MGLLTSIWRPLAPARPSRWSLWKQRLLVCQPGFPSKPTVKKNNLPRLLFQGFLWVMLLLGVILLRWPMSIADSTRPGFSVLTLCKLTGFLVSFEPNFGEKNGRTSKSYFRSSCPAKSQEIVSPKVRVVTQKSFSLQFFHEVFFKCIFIDYTLH